MTSLLLFFAFLPGTFFRSIVKVVIEMLAVLSTVLPLSRAVPRFHQPIKTILDPVCSKVQKWFLASHTDNFLESCRLV